MENIQDYHRYTTLMRNGFYDKLFFVDKLFGDWNGIFDYGCADGFLTKMIAEIFPDKRIVGYDSDTHMIDGAKYSGTYPANVEFISTTDLKDIPDVLLLSSVIHEVYSYREDIKDFWDMVFNGNFKKIMIRDMMVDHHSYDHLIYPDNIRKWCNDNNLLAELQYFEHIWGSINIPKNQTHFLLKYLYTTSPNWNREVHENYLAFTVRDFHDILPRNYRIIYEECRALPYLAYRWKQDFGIDIPPKTHSKLILERI